MSSGRFDARKTTGQTGEDLAADYLQKQGYRIIDRNWRCRMGEIDIIARDGATVVVVEVRSKSGERFGTGLESVSGRKLSKLIGLAELYLNEKKLRNVPVRLDIVSIAFLKDGAPKIDHVKNVTG